MQRLKEIITGAFRPGLDKQAPFSPDPKKDAPYSYEAVTNPRLRQYLEKFEREVVEKEQEWPMRFANITIKPTPKVLGFSGVGLRSFANKTRDLRVIDVAAHYNWRSGTPFYVLSQNGFRALAALCGTYNLTEYHYGHEKDLTEERMHKIVAKTKEFLGEHPLAKEIHDPRPGAAPRLTATPTPLELKHTEEPVSPSTRDLEPAVDAENHEDDYVPRAYGGVGDQKLRKFLQRYEIDAQPGGQPLISLAEAIGQALSLLSSALPADMYFETPLREACAQDLIPGVQSAGKYMVVDENARRIIAAACFVAAERYRQEDTHEPLEERAIMFLTASALKPDPLSSELLLRLGQRQN